MEDNRCDRSEMQVKRLKTNEEMSEEVMGRKSSFDRFGDDLTEELLRYLTVDDRLRLECLNRTIKSFIFKSVYILKISKDCFLTNKLTLITSEHKSYFHFNHQNFESMIRKLKNLSNIEFDEEVVIDSTALKTIADNCHHLKSLTIGPNRRLSYESIEYFGRKCGAKLKSLTVNNILRNYKLVEETKLLLSFTPELVSLKVTKLI